MTHKTTFSLPTDRAGGGEGTGIVLSTDPTGLPRIAWLGPTAVALDAIDVLRAVGDDGPAPSVHQSAGRSLPLLLEVSTHWYGQPGLRGHRLTEGSPGADWSTAFIQTGVSTTERSLLVSAADQARGLELDTVLESVAGGPLRIRHTVRNTGVGDYVLDALDVMLPVPDRVGELLDLTGRWGRERSPQRHPVRDGIWLREGRTGKTGPESVTVLSVGTAGFNFGSGEVWGIHLAWSGNSRHFLQRLPSGQTVLGAGELLLPGELVLGPGASYTTPWVFIAASESGLDGLAEQFHGYLRALPAHPNGPRPVVCNVWEAVYFDHDLDRLTELADQAASIGIERFVLDDGWFSSRRNDRSGLGDWTVSADVWPDGLGPLIEHVRTLGMQFGLWFEPEMLNADSELFRAHPDWVLAVQDRPLREFRNQLVLDLGRPQVRDYLFDQITAVLGNNAIDFVKWDHNRSLGDGASGIRGGGAGVHAQTIGFYELLDRLRAAHPGVEWESCASGGARIDLAVLERSERVWTSDMTDALARQHIQRWTGQLVAPEYLGAHVSAPINHQTGRQLSLDFRVATAFFGDLGVEWDITGATDAERARLAEWIALYKARRPLLHGGRTIRVDSTEAAHWSYGVRSHDRSEAIMAYVQLDEAVREPAPFLVPGLDPNRRYQAHEITPEVPAQHPELAGYRWRGEGMMLSGAVLAAVGLPAPERWPQSALIVELRAI